MTWSNVTRSQSVRSGLLLTARVLWTGCRRDAQRDGYRPLARPERGLCESGLDDVRDGNGAGHADWVGHPVGRLLLYDIPPVLWRFFRENYARCLHEARPWEHRYECSSPDLERHFQMTVYPLGESEGLLSIHSLLVETPHAGPELPPVENRYRIDPEGYFIQCCHCRRFQRTGQENSWDWIPKWVEAPPPNTSHGFCPPCFRFYYHEDRILNNEFPESFRTGNDPSGSDP